jgi:hypothetical protein
VCWRQTKKAFFSEWSRDNLVRRANRYVVELLLPDFMIEFEPRSKKRDMTIETVRSLAATFKMSLTETAIRFVELGSFPAMLVFSEAGKRRWFVHGQDVPEAIWPKESPNAYTVAFELHRDGKEEEGPTDVQADGRIDPPRAKWYTLRKRSVKSVTTMSFRCCGGRTSANCSILKRLNDGLEGAEN